MLVPELLLPPRAIWHFYLEKLGYCRGGYSWEEDGDRLPVQVGLVDACTVRRRELGVVSVAVAPTPYCWVNLIFLKFLEALKIGPGVYLS